MTLLENILYEVRTRMLRESWYPRSLTPEEQEIREKLRKDNKTFDMLLRAPARGTYYAWEKPRLASTTRELNQLQSFLENAYKIQEQLKSDFDKEYINTLNTIENLMPGSVTSEARTVIGYANRILTVLELKEQLINIVIGKTQPQQSNQAVAVKNIVEKLQLNLNPAKISGDTLLYLLTTDKVQVKFKKLTRTEQNKIKAQVKKIKDTNDIIENLKTKIRRITQASINIINIYNSMNDNVDSINRLQVRIKQNQREK